MTESSPQNSFASEEYSQKNEKQSIEFQAAIKSESSFFPTWKDKYVAIVYLPNLQFTLTIYHKDKRTIDEAINLYSTKVSKRCTTIDGKLCFALEMHSKKRFLVGGDNQANVQAACQLISGIKKTLKQSQFSTAYKQTKQVSTNKEQKLKLQFQKASYSQDRQKEIRQRQAQALLLANQIPSHQPQTIQQQRQYQKALNSEIERGEEFHTVLQSDPIVIQKQQPLHLKLPLDQEQLQYLQSDQSFKLFQTFPEGRILQKDKKIIKANLLLKTELTVFQLMESFFRLELWNQKVKNYKLLNRIDEGIYLIQMELVKKGIFSSPKFCKMMVSTLILHNQPYLIMRSLQENSFQKKPKKQKIDCSVWLKVRAEDKQKKQKLVGLCAAVEKEKDFELMMSFLQQIKYYQSFLLTTNRPPNRVLQWRKQEKSYFIE